MADIDRLTALIAPEAEALGLRLVRVVLLGGQSDPTLQVMAERPETRQLTLEDCALLSRRLSDVLDEADPIEHAYRLEVSSPGIDRPLTRLADYRDWAGHMARLRLSRTIEGRKQLDGEVLGLVEPGDGPDGAQGPCVRIAVVKGRDLANAPEGEMLIPFDAIERSKLILTDKLIAATAPLSAEGADRVIEEER